MKRSSYYDWLSRKESRRSKRNRELVFEIKVAHQESHKTYGAIRMKRELNDKGINVSKNRIAQLMRKEGLKSVHTAKFKVQTTDSNHNLAVAENLINQNFDCSAPNQKWGCDISYVKTGEGFLYLAVVLDFFSRRVVGWAIGDSLHTELCCQALTMAITRRNPPKDLIHHSDRGSQYAAWKYCMLLREKQFNQSMSRKGNCYDNAMVESFFHTLKVECVYQNSFATKKQATAALINYIEHFYNPKRRHSALDYVSPVDYELRRVA